MFKKNCISTSLINLLFIIIIFNCFNVMYRCVLNSPLVACHSLRNFALVAITLFKVEYYCSDKSSSISPRTLSIAARCKYHIHVFGVERSMYGVIYRKFQCWSMYCIFIIFYYNIFVFERVTLRVDLFAMARWAVVVECISDSLVCQHTFYLLMRTRCNPAFGIVKLIFNDLIIRWIYSCISLSMRYLVYNSLFYTGFLMLIIIINEFRIILNNYHYFYFHSV